MKTKESLNLKKKYMLTIFFSSLYWNVYSNWLWIGFIKLNNKKSVLNFNTANSSSIYWNHWPTHRSEIHNEFSRSISVLLVSFLRGIYIKR